MADVQTRPQEGSQRVQGLVGASGLNFVGSVVVAGSNVLLLALLTNGLGSGGAGAFLEAVAVVTILSTVTTLGADTGLIKSLATSAATGRTDSRLVMMAALAPVLVVSVVAATLLALLAEPVARLVGDPTHASAIASYLRVMAPFVPVTAVLAALLGATRGVGTMTPTVVLDRLLRPAAQLVAMAVVIVIGGTQIQLGLAWAAPLAAALAGALVWYRRLGTRHLPGGDDPQGLRATARRFWSFTLPRALAAGLQILVQWLDVLLVGALMSTRDAGVYAVATRVLQMGFYVIYAVGQAIQPRLAALWAAEDRERLQAVYQRSTVWTVIIVWPVFVLAAVAAPAILHLFGDDFANGAAVVAVLAASGLFSSAVGSVDMVLLMAGGSTANLVITGVGLAVNVVLNVLLIPVLGISGAAVAWAAARVLSKSLSLAYVRRHVAVHPYDVDALRAGIAALLLFGVGGILVRSAAGPDLLSFAVALPLMAGAYLFAVRGQLDELRTLLARRRQTPSLS